MIADQRDDGYEAAQQLAGSHDCPDCRHRSVLVVRWFQGAYQAWCPRCRRSDGFLRRKSLTQQWKENPESVPLYTANALERKFGGTPLTSTALANMDEKSLMQRMEGARWLSQVSAQDRRSLAQLAIEYQLDPLMGELIIYEGKPYITIGGMIRTAHRSPQFAGLEDRPMSQDERAAYGMKKPVCWIAKAYRADWKVPAVGTGQADPERPFRNNPTERENPQWMARSRAIRQALRLAFPHSVPFQMEAAEDRGIRVDLETGEITTPEPERPALAVVAPPAEPEPIDQLPFDESDRPEPAAGEEDGLAAEARRAELLAGLRDLAGKSRTGWDGLLKWWPTQFDATPETAPVEQLEVALSMLTKTKVGK